MHERRIPFLGWFLFATAVAVLLIAFLGWHIDQSHRFFGEIGSELVRQTGAVARLRELRWGLTQATQAAHHLALFGDGEDGRRAYDEAQRRLDAELESDLGLPEQAPERASLAVLAKLTQSLGAIEVKAMAAAQEGRKDEALGLLHSHEYTKTRACCALRPTRTPSRSTTVYRGACSLMGQARSPSSRSTLRCCSLPGASGGDWLCGCAAGRGSPIPSWESGSPPR